MIKEIVKKSRSYRGYDESYRFTKEQMMEYIDTTRYTPSSVNAQPLKYFAAWEKEDTDKLMPCTHWAKALKDIELPHKGKCPTGFIVICQDTDIDPSLTRYQKDIGIVAQTILLEAVEQGLGGCMIGNFKAGEVKEVLSLPENIAPMLIVALGKPDEEIIIKEINNGDSIQYYRDENDIHYVPKRKLEDIIINK